MNKKQRISHLTSRVQPSFGGYLPASQGKAAADPPPPPPAPAAATPAPLLLPHTLPPTSNPPQTATSSSPSTPEGQGTQDLPVDSFSQNSSSVYKDQEQKYTSWTPLGIPAPAVVQRETPKSADQKHAVLHEKHKNVKQHKERDESKTQDTTSMSKEGTHLRKEETAKLKTSSCSDSGEGINTLLLLTTIWVTLVKRDQ